MSLIRKALRETAVATLVDRATASKIKGLRGDANTARRQRDEARAQRDELRQMLSDQSLSEKETQALSDAAGATTAKLRGRIDGFAQRLKRLEGELSEKEMTPELLEVFREITEEHAKLAAERLHGEIQHLKEKNRLARQHRDEARAQRDIARQERNEARAQNRELHGSAPQQDSGKPASYFKKLSRGYAELQDWQDKDLPFDKAPLAVKELSSQIRPPEFSKLFPRRHCPPASLGFVTVVNDLFLPGLELLLASLLDVYPDFESDVVVFHDGTLSDFSMRRVQGLYPKVRFVQPDMTWLSAIPTDSKNRRRIGILGYMSVMALELQQYERVVVLDSDTAILDDISMFWTGKDVPLGSPEAPPALDPDTIFMCMDYGVRPWSAYSDALQQPILNSGILSIPRRYMTQDDIAEIQRLVQENHESFCPLLDRFADQKAWNRFVRSRDARFLPINFNCNVSYLGQYRGGDTSFVRMVHFTGYKPWFDQNYIEKEKIPTADKQAVNPGLWRGLYKQKVGALRQRQYQAEIAKPGYFDQRVDAPKLIDGQPTCMFIGNGPSLKETDLSKLAGFETFAFNWFILHPEFDTIKPDHLVLGSHMLFGGWQTMQPEIPEAFIEGLCAKSWRPTIWTSFYFREYFEASPLAEQYQIKYVLFEKPHKEFIDVMGATNMDVRGFTHDGHTGVLSLGVPIALQQGYGQIGLVGCDSNYNQQGQGSSNYFYDAAKHVSKETRAQSLTKTWVDGGTGYFAYTRIQESLQRRGGGFIDYTLNGALPLPKGDLSTL